MHKINLMTMAFIAIAFIAGCAKKTPKCSDEQTLDLVRSIIVDNYKPDGISDAEFEANLRFSLPRATRLDEGIKKYSCEAKLIVANTKQFPISYESQLNDGDQHIVSVEGDGYLVSGIKETIREVIIYPRLAKEREQKRIRYAEGKKGFQAFANSLSVPANLLSKKELMWQDDESVKSNELTWHEAINYCNNLTLDGHSDWRLPTINELLSITDDTKYDPAIIDGLQYATSGFYWSSSPYVSDTSFAWFVYFKIGYDFWYGKSTTNLVRCVRDSQ